MSVEATHARFICDELTAVAVKPVGVVGGVESMVKAADDTEEFVCSGLQAMARIVWLDVTLIGEEKTVPVEQPSCVALQAGVVPVLV